MPDDKKEPQSYGSQGDWSSGKTGEAVNQQDTSSPPPDRHVTQANDPRIGGDVSPVQLAENVELRAAAAPTEDDAQPISKVTTAPSGAKRGGFFKQRDYE